ncbi:hypothetical protein LshimejAT787_0604010 [Lyophyllum shimeji]|uniref:Uncharacterized protein n=1 Tax=Lyophyllum shimeji TaxID=47721 RepID=A0A9P3PPM4_LYOSH|nr:hypothetical protein LshimejAT787_0604010 [Lyophyllum shimeji]
MDTALSRTSTDSSRRGPIHDKTSYGIIATPPSPTNTSPTLTQSTSKSTSTPSTSPPLPTTPRSGRSRTRYPELGRVPLHRRGTSKTYERLEDLLREAGYKETRVFTPEEKRNETQRDDLSSGQRAGVRESVGALMGYLAGFMPNAAANRSTASLGASPEEGQAYSPPASPLAQRQTHKQKQRQDTSSSSEPHTPSPLSSRMTSSMESLEPTPRPSRHRPPSRSATPVPASSMYSHSQSSQQDLHRPLMTHRSSAQSYTSATSRRPPFQTRPSQTSLYHRSSDRLPTAGPSNQSMGPPPRPSRAHAYLRHMASAPNMPVPKRPGSLPPVPAQYLPRRDVDNGDTEDAEPPLPRTWLESVARAVLFGGVGAYIGGPSVVDPPSQAVVKTLRATRSSLSQTSSAKHPGKQPVRSGLSDQTNIKKSGAGANELLFVPPELFARLERGRAATSKGEVSRTRVVCRSAPVSRASSVVRGVGGGGGEDGKEKRDRIGKESEQGRGRARGRAVERDRVPSLANTRTEGDAWVAPKRVKKDMGSARSRYLSGWGMEVESSDGDEGGVSCSSEEEEDGELNLAKMLVNPKRQHSIKSLRKHLRPPGGEEGTAKVVGMSAGRTMTPGSAQGSRSGSVRRRMPEDRDWGGSEVEDWGRGWLRKGARRRNSEEEDDDESYAAKFLGDGRGERKTKPPTVDLRL